ncbi:16S rRNA (uracil(1498)-N(3))-methyltransferase [[Clostridium] scindens]|uniref:16S rRNA (uracil(1498)-N(3))-methyltransferase n=1 Tax=Clostridium scindens (strain JCM 10418 / VPI 12708) TaxID=29347 RepID=UPI00242DECAF|nr:16S rRNA (uracil(1498)-N(3))-methyltransferase [[Clostridium] scindens]
MQHFFVTPSQVEGERIYIEGSDVNHMKNVLRMRPGEAVAISDGDNLKYRCVVEGYEEGRAVLAIQQRIPVDTELPCRIILFQGLPKQDKMELIVQKAVELGASQVVPVATRRSVVKLDEKKAAKKLQRWQQIAESAAKQAGRGYIPQVSSVLSYQEALEKAGELDVLLIPYESAEGMEEARKVVASIAQGQSVGIFIGPEGGFEKEEVDAAIHQGAKAITLGRRILRTETAGLAILSILMFRLEG